jgi:hypothetical protein
MFLKMYLRKIYISDGDKRRDDSFILVYRSNKVTVTKRE